MLAGLHAKRPFALHWRLLRIWRHEQGCRPAVQPQSGDADGIRPAGDRWRPDGCELWHGALQGPTVCRNGHRPEPLCGRPQRHRQPPARNHRGGRTGHRTGRGYDRTHRNQLDGEALCVHAVEHLPRQSGGFAEPRFRDRLRQQHQGAGLWPRLRRPSERRPVCAGKQRRDRNAALRLDRLGPGRRQRIPADLQDVRGRPRRHRRDRLRAHAAGDHLPADHVRHRRHPHELRGLAPGRVQ